jgi:hypothetical protein
MIVDKPVPTRKQMDGPEPLIARYNLKNWRNNTYSGNDINKQGSPFLKSSYRGIVKLVSNPSIGSPVDTAPDEAIGDDI